ncbi:MAG TPA: SDR family NAD(P)-dependent oxidoreductase [Acidobacteriota bacterium]|nr:SDR family NAD(P)-dependent oxidoreductase [Acidobacteriota bacterium]
MPEGKPSVLITGANGFIGSALCRRFLSSGYDVVAGVRESADLTFLKDLPVRYRYGDVTDAAGLPEMVGSVDYVVHNAGIVKARNPAAFFDVNARGTARLFDAIAAHNAEVKKVVYMSSQAVGGPSSAGRPVAESDPPNPVTAYGRSKAEGEKAALSYRDRLHVVSIRPPAVYGPGDTEMFALFKAVYWHLKPYIGDLDRRIQLVHVYDLSRGVVQAVSSRTQSGAVYHIAENRSYTLRELTAVLERASGRRALPLRLPSGVFRLAAAVSEFVFKLVGATPMVTRDKTRELLASWQVSTERARVDLDFESAIPLEQGAGETYGWYLKHGWL